MKGELVIVRSYGGKPLSRRVWDTNDHIIYIINDQQFQLLMKGADAIGPVGFPREDVFKYDQTLAESMEQHCKNETWDWDKLVNF